MVLSAQAEEPRTLCEAEIAHQAFVLKYRQSRFGVGLISEADVLKSENALLLVQHNCQAIGEESYQEKVLVNHARLLEMSEGGFRVGLVAREDLNATILAGLDFKWGVVAISTLDYCQEKFKVLVENRKIARGNVGVGIAMPSAVLEAELAIQRHREFCSLEGSISLPPVDAAAGDTPY